MVTQGELKVFSQQIVARVAKEARKLEGEKQRLSAALSQSEQNCMRVSSFNDYTSTCMHRGHHDQLILVVLCTVIVSYVSISCRRSSPV